MILIYVEDRACKVFMSYLCKFNRISSRVRMPRAEGGGWTEVLKSVHSLNETNRVIGVIEGDSRKQAEKLDIWGDISDKIYITEKSELEKYIFDKRQALGQPTDLPVEMNFKHFKKYLNKEEYKAIADHAISSLAREKCNEITGIIAFLEQE